MGSPTKIRAASKDGVTEVKMQMSHDMENGRRKDASGAVVPAWFITALSVKCNDRLVLAGEFGTSVSKNPHLVCRFRGGNPGDKIVVSWTDNKGDARRDEAVVT